MKDNKQPITKSQMELIDVISDLTRIQDWLQINIKKYETFYNLDSTVAKLKREINQYFNEPKKGK